MSLNAKSLKTQHLRIGAAAGLLTAAVCCSAQTASGSYPQGPSQVHEFRAHSLPNWFSLEGELRTRTEGTTALNETTSSDLVYQLTRVRGAVLLHPGKQASAYIQFHDTHALGLALPRVASNMRDEFDLRQGYIQWQVPRLRLRAGRQELRYGSERLIGISDWTNNSRTFDGFALHVGDIRNIEFFTSSVVVVHPTAHDDHGTGLTFHGLYAHIPGVLPKADIQPFLLIKALRTVTGSNSKIGSELEFTVGAEVEGAWSRHLSYELNGAIQKGRYADDVIRAGAAFGKLAYTANEMRWRPRVTAEFDFASGNDPAAMGRRSTFDQQYPSNHNAFGLIDLFAYQNIRMTRIHLDLQPGSTLNLLLQASNLDLADKRDSVYASGGSVLLKVPTTGFATSHLGYEFDLSGRYSFRQSYAFQSGIGYFTSGMVLSTGHLNPSQLLGYLSLTYRFAVHR